MTCQKTRCRWRQCSGCGRERRLARDGEVLCRHNRWDPAFGAMVPCGGSGQEPGAHSAHGDIGDRVMAFRKIAYLIPGCDGCGLAWSFGDPACVDGIPPHFTSTASALGQLAADYGWQVVRRGLGRPLMACRHCAAAGVIPATSGRRWLLAAAGRVRRFVPFGPVRRATAADLPAAHPESVTAVLPPDQEDLLAALDDELFPDR